MLLIGLIAGIIIGWLSEWIIDWWFWRNEDGPSIPFGAPDRPNVELQRALDAARAEAADLRTQLAALQPGISSNVGAEAAGPVLTPSEPTSAAGNARDDLKLIKGIGRVYEGKLNSVGIYTFADVVNASAEKLSAAIEPQEWQELDVEGWAEEASAFAKSAAKSDSPAKGE